MGNLLSRYRNLPIAVRASFWFLLASFLQKAISALTTPIFTRLMNTTEYGAYSVYDSWFNIISIFVCLNLFAGFYVRGLTKYNNDREKFSSSLLGLTTTLVCIWLLIYLLFNSFWNNLFDLTTLQMFSLLARIWGTSCFCFWAMEKRVELNYKKLIILSIFMSLVKPVAAIIAVSYAEDKVTARIIAVSIVEVLGYSFCFVDQMCRGKAFFNMSYWKSALLFAIPLIPHYLSMEVLNSADKIMIKNMISESAAGIYALAYSLSKIMVLFNTALNQTVEPWLYKKINDNQIDELAKVAFPCFVLIAIVNALLIAFAPEAVAIFAPAEYYDAIWIIPPVAMSVYFMFLYTFFAVFEFYFKKTRLIAIATCFGAVLNVGLNYIFIDLVGYYAAGYTTLVCYIAYALVHYVFMKKICLENFKNANPYNTKKLMSISASFVAIGLLLTYTYKYMYMRYFLISGILFIILTKKAVIIRLVKSIIELKRKKD